MKELINFDRDVTMKDLYPNSIEIKYDYIKIDNKYIATLTIIGFPNKVKFMGLMKELVDNMSCQITFNIEKLNTSQELKKITQTISICKSEKSTINNNQKDIDIINNIEEKATELRRKVQIENEELYDQAIYISVCANSKEKLINKIKVIEDKMFARGYVVRPSNFRQKEAYLCTLPLCINRSFALKNTDRTITSMMLAYNFMFFTNRINMPNGTIIGLYNKSPCIYDVFFEKHNNYNMCILGSSGAGKSYFTKLFIIRNLYVGTNQIILDPEGEYTNMVKDLGGIVLDETNYNLMYIDEAFAIKNNGKIITEKTNRIIKIVEEINNKEMSTETKEYFIAKIAILYNNKNIYESLENYYVLSKGEQTYINKKYLRDESFPTMYELIELINHDKKAGKSVKEEIMKLLKNNMLQDLIKARRQTNIINCIDNTNIIKCFDLSKVKERYISFYIYIYLLSIEDLLGEKTIIYVDELWKSIEFDVNEILSNKIIQLFKTLRKRNAGIAIITQDLEDLFKSGKEIGKLILNNCYTKVFFKMEYTDIAVLRNLGIYEENTIKRICGLRKGQALLNMGGTMGILDINASKLEHYLIEEGSINNEQNISSIVK